MPAFTLTGSAMAADLCLWRAFESRRAAASSEHGGEVADVVAPYWRPAGVKFAGSHSRCAGVRIAWPDAIRAAIDAQMESFGRQAVGVGQRRTAPATG